MYRYKFFLLVCLALYVAACSVNEPAVKTNQENEFWKAFRQAALADDKDEDKDKYQETLIALTHFPFEVRTSDDSVPPKTYEQKDFNPVFERLLAQQVYFPDGGSISSKSMRQMIEAKPQITAGDFITPTLIQFLQFEFEYIDGQWLFTRAYLED